MKKRSKESLQLEHRLQEYRKLKDTEGLALHAAIASVAAEIVRMIDHVGGQHRNLLLYYGALSGLYSAVTLEEEGDELLRQLLYDAKEYVLSKTTLKTWNI